MPFRDREEAAELLAERLADLRGRRPLILAIPRGGVPMGRILADRLEGELDLALVHKVGAPDNPEYALGAVDVHGNRSWRPAAARYPEETLARLAERERARLVERRRRWGALHPPRDPHGRTVVLVDDGIATGATMAAAIELVRRAEPAEVVVAAAVAPPETAAALAQLADRVEILETPEPFFAVGQFFADFRPVSDAEVEAALRAEVET